MGKAQDTSMGFTRFVEMGRVVLIIDVIDQNRCMVYSPETTPQRRETGYKRLSLTDLKIDIQRAARQKTCEKAWAASDVNAKWESTSWAKKIAARKAKATDTDFQRFKNMVAKKKQKK